jgi:hypothetical protein
VTFSIDEVNDDESARLAMEDESWDEPFVSSSLPAEIPEYFRIKVPTKDDFMTIATIYDGKEDEHIERNEFTVRWLTDKNGEPYKFASKEEARVFLALNVDSAFIRPTDRAQSIEAYAIRQD